MYDGYNSLRKRLFRTITVSKNASKDELLRASMTAFVVTQVLDMFPFLKMKTLMIIGIPKLLSS